jgi:hypothetical protein
MLNLQNFSLTKKIFGNKKKIVKRIANYQEEGRVAYDGQQMDDGWDNA